MEIKNQTSRRIGIDAELNEEKNDVVIKIGMNNGVAIATLTINGIEQSAFTTSSKLPLEYLRFTIDGGKSKKKREFPFKLTKFEVYATPPFFKGTFESKK